MGTVGKQAEEVPSKGNVGAECSLPGLRGDARGKVQAKNGKIAGGGGVASDVARRRW